MPVGIFSTENFDPRVGVAIGEYILDLCVLGQDGLFDLLDIDPTVFNRSSLNDFIRLGKPTWQAVRERISELLRNDNDEIRDNDELMHRCLVKQIDATLHLPINITNYIRFNQGQEQLVAINKLSEKLEKDLLPEPGYPPIGYQESPASVMVSGTPFYNPGIKKTFQDSTQPTIMPLQELDFGMELGFITGVETQPGATISVNEADNLIFGTVLLTNWYSRNIPSSESSLINRKADIHLFTCISPWVVMLDALEPFRVPGPEQNLSGLPYQEYSGIKHLDIELTAYLKGPNQTPILVDETNSRYLSWNINQQLAHRLHTGFPIQSGDLYGSGITDNNSQESYGLLPELTRPGNKPLQFPDGTTRASLQEDDTIIIRGQAMRNGLRIGFGEVKTKVLPAQ